MWEKVIDIKKAIKALDGRHDQPWLMKGIDDKNYVVKFKRSDHSSIMNEIFTNKLAQKLDLPVAKMFLVNVSENIINNIESLKSRKIKPGHHIGFEYLSPSYTLNCDDAKYIASNKIKNLSDVPKMIVFDILLYNQDRHEGNSLIVQTDTGYEYYLIDHGMIFNGRSWTNALSNLKYRQNPIFWDVSKTTRRKYGEFIDKIKELVERDYWDAINDVLDEFLISGADKQKVVDKLISDDKDQITGFIFAQGV